MVGLCINKLPCNRFASSFFKFCYLVHLQEISDQTTKYSCDHVNFKDDNLISPRNRLSTRNLTPRIAQAYDKALLDLSDKYGLTQHVHVSSQTRVASGRTLNLVLSSNPSIIQGCHVTCGISDHDATLFEIDISPKFTPKPPRKIYQFHKGDFVDLKASLTTLSSDCLSAHPEWLWTKTGLTFLKRS